MMKRWTQKQESSMLPKLCSMLVCYAELWVLDAADLLCFSLYVVLLQLRSAFTESIIEILFTEFQWRSHTSSFLLSLISAPVTSVITGLPFACRPSWFVHHGWVSIFSTVFRLSVQFFFLFPIPLFLTVTYTLHFIHFIYSINLSVYYFTGYYYRSRQYGIEQNIN